MRVAAAVINPNLTNGFAMCRVPLCQFQCHCRLVQVGPAWPFGQSPSQLGSQLTSSAQLSGTSSVCAHFLLPSPRGALARYIRNLFQMPNNFNCNIPAMNGTAATVAEYSTHLTHSTHTHTHATHTLHTHCTLCTHNLSMFVVLSRILCSRQGIIRAKCSVYSQKVLAP